MDAQPSRRPRIPRIGIAGIAIESSTFSPHRSGAGDFEVRRGTGPILERYPFFTAPTDPTLRHAAEFAGVLHARALPGGPLDRGVYDGWKAEIVDGLAAAHAQAPLDGFFFDIHGAMSVVGLEDAEGDLITAIRAAIGPDVVVGAAMDLHGNVSETLFEACDLLTCYRHAPHIDAWETRERGLRDLIDAAARVAAGGPRPHRALVHIPLLLPGEKTSTRVEPARSLYGRIPELTERPGVRDASFWIGFAWADQPRCKAAIVVHGEDAEAVDAAALELATAVWQARHDFEFVAPTGSFEECLDRAIASDRRPFWISDSGDNPGAGGADDTTYALAQLLERPEIRGGAVSALMVSLVDPESTDAAWALGVGGSGEFRIGATIDTRAPGPVRLRARIEALDDSAPTGRAAALRVLDGDRPTGLTVVITQRRSQWATRAMFARLGLSMTGFDVVTVKMGYLEPEQYEAAADWLLALTPGGVDQDLLRLGHHRIDRPMLPFDEEIPPPTADSLIHRGGPRSTGPDGGPLMRDAERWEALPKRLPRWFEEAPLGIFIHWGAYSVPAWAEPTAELGAIESDLGWFAHNPYAEWYYNTIRIDGSPAQKHHQEVHGGAPYDDFLDQWKATAFDPAQWLELFKAAGADYVVPTTKHHDGIPLWDAPDTGTRNTVHRGPRRDLVGEIARATQEAGLRFGVYYSGGLDWHVRPTEPLVEGSDVHDKKRPRDDEYGQYCSSHMRDLIDRYSPDIFWNDIGWPDENFHFGPGGLGELLEHFYTQRPEGLINDRFAGAHHDFVTTEYQSGEIPENEPWENCRGIGLSFGYNQVEDESQHLTGAQVSRHVVDAVSKGGRVLLNIGPRADGSLHELQVAALQDLGDFMDEAKPLLSGATGLGEVTAPDISWGRAVEQDGICHVFLSGDEGSVTIPAAALPAGYAWPAEGVTVDLAGERSAPVLVSASRA